MGRNLFPQKGMISMRCLKCNLEAYKSTTTDVTDLGKCLVIVRNVPCYKCPECDEVIYTGDVIRQLEQIIIQARKTMNEVSIINYHTPAA